MDLNGAHKSVEKTEYYLKDNHLRDYFKCLSARFYGSSKVGKISKICMLDSNSNHAIY